MMEISSKPGTGMNRVKLNPAGWLAEIFISSKLTPLFILACVILGVVAITQTPREENPQILVPGAEIMVTLPGASAHEVEQLVVNPPGGPGTPNQWSGSHLCRGYEFHGFDSSAV